MKITFHGAAQEVTGSLYLIEAEGKKVLVDCGIHQGGIEDAERNREDFPFDPKEIDAVFLTHGHMDHTGRVPLLVKRGFSGPIHCTAPTAELAHLIWDDIVNIAIGNRRRAKKEGKEPVEPMYSKDDSAKAYGQVKDVSYGQSFKMAGDVFEVTFHDAGHILGSSFIEIKAGGRTVVFSGDLGNEDMPIMKPTQQLVATDVLVMESTYGNREHEPAETRKSTLMESVMQIVENKGTLVIPSFAIERTQEIVITLHRLAEEGKIPRIPIFLDSPMAIRATRVYEDHPEYYNNKARDEFLLGHRIFSLPGFVATETSDESRRINDVSGPKVVIAGSGMMTGGRIHHHLIRYLPDPNSILLVVGYQAVRTLGRTLIEGAKTVEIFDKEVSVRAKIKKVGSWSAHADKKKLLKWVKEAEKPPGTIIVSHGEEDASAELAETLQEELDIDAHVPNLGQTFEIHEHGIVIE